MGKSVKTLRDSQGILALLRQRAGQPGLEELHGSATIDSGDRLVVLEEYDPALVILNPVNLSVTPDSVSRAKLLWSDRSDNETGFEIWRAAGTSGTFSLVATVNSDVTAYTDVNLSPSTKFFIVHAKSFLVLLFVT